MRRRTTSPLSRVKCTISERAGESLPSGKCCPRPFKTLYVEHPLRRGSHEKTRKTYDRPTLQRALRVTSRQRWKRILLSSSEASYLECSPSSQKKAFFVAPRHTCPSPPPHSQVEHQASSSSYSFSPPSSSFSSPSSSYSCSSPPPPSSSSSSSTSPTSSSLSGRVSIAVLLLPVLPDAHQRRPGSRGGSHGRHVCVGVHVPRWCHHLNKSR